MENGAVSCAFKRIRTENKESSIGSRYFGPFDKLRAGFVLCSLFFVLALEAPMKLSTTRIILALVLAFALLPLGAFALTVPDPKAMQILVMPLPPGRELLLIATPCS